MTEELIQNIDNQDSTALAAQLDALTAKPEVNEINEEIEEEEVEEIEELDDSSESEDQEDPEDQEEKVDASKAENEELKKELARIRRQVESLKALSEKNQSKEDEYVLPDDPEELLKQLASNPKEILQKAVMAEVSKVQNAITEIQRDQAITYVSSQKDFYDGMIDDLVDIIEENNDKFFAIDGKNYKLKDLPPVTKAQAALQVLRDSKKETEQQPKKIIKPKPPSVTTSKKKTKSLRDVSDETLTAAQYLQKYGLEGKVGDI